MMISNTLPAHVHKEHTSIDEHYSTRAYLRYRFDEDTILIYLNKGRLLIGRSEKADIVLPSRVISRLHAMVTSHTGPQGRRIYSIEDLNSCNGTFVNTYLIDSVELNDRDVISIGRTDLEFRIHSYEPPDASSI